MSNTTIIEYGRIYCLDDFSGEKPDSSPDRVYLSRATFENLRYFIAENINETLEIDKSFSVHRQKGKTYIRVKNYVGVIETADGATLEILPKIYQKPSHGSRNSIDPVESTRFIFLRMLKRLRNSPFINIDNAHLKSHRFPILEVFITTFLEELTILVKRGLRRHYITQEQNQPFLKGKLLFGQNIRQNLVHPERFYTQYDVFSANIPQNRLIISTLQLLAEKSQSVANQNLIRKYLFTFDEIPGSTNVVYDFGLTDARRSRIFSAYDQLLKWSRVFLLDGSFTNFRGHHHNKAILFPMERIFEDYVSYGFRKYVKDYSISSQDRKHHLVMEHRGSGRFRLRPDIVLRNLQGQHTIVIDCKWKLLNEKDVRKNYGIAQSDMYQLYAYGKKYRDPKCTQLVLLYPKQEFFQEPLPTFDYELGLPLVVLPVDLEGDLNREVQSIVRGLQ